MNSALNYYEILECSPSATFEELKKSYQRLVKQNHPDKLSPISLSESTDVNVTNSDRFLLIDEAWKVLRDTQQRKIYDSSRLQLEINQNSVIYAEITLESLYFNEDSVAYYLCRCGDHFQIHKDDFNESELGEEVLFECSECSNNILVKVT